ncbi:MAG: hypothetical protein JWM80_2243 [Cyanobacteria bacterium RYN_339]|nr:hypothetical protein [Cyanobacteria bacterium RYN_339]
MLATPLRLTFRRTPGAAPPAELVARALGGLQKLACLLGSGARRTYELTCRFQEDGLELHVGGPQLALGLDLGSTPAEVGQRLLRIWCAAAEGGLAAALPDADFRAEVLAELKRLLPRPSEGWTVALDGVAIDPALARSLAKALDTAKEVAPAVLTITGELLGVDFDHGTFSLRYMPTRKTLTGRYQPEAEVWLLKHRRKTIQVDGEFSLDGQQRPQACLKALKFRAVELAPLSLVRVPLPGGELLLEPPLVLTPSLDLETGQRYEAREDALGLFALAESREGLEAALNEQIARLWLRPAEADPLLSKLWKRRARELSAYQEA